MKPFRIAVIFYGSCLSLSVFPQSKVVSQRKSISELSKEQYAKPAILDIVKESVAFEDDSGQNYITAGKTYQIKFKVKNTGEGDGRNCKLVITSSGKKQGIVFSDITIPTISAGTTTTIEVPFSTDMTTQDGQVLFTMKVDEPHGFGTDPFVLQIPTKAFVSPLVKVADYSIASKVKKKKPFDLQVLLQNTEQGMAEDVNIRLTLPDNVLLLEGDPLSSIGMLAGGEAKLMTYTLIANGNYSGKEIPITINLSEKHGKYARNKTVLLDIDQAYEKQELAIVESKTIQEEISIASLRSDVDVNIPTTNTVQSNTFAVIIANEHYAHVSSVPYAINDGNIFKQYCHKTLGIPQDNIRFKEDATLGELTNLLDWISEVMNVYQGNAKIIFYYAGHGVPDERTKEAYILPVDGYGNNLKSALSLSSLYATLSLYASSSTMVLLDACFSGANRDGNMLVSARGVAIKPKKYQPIGNMVVFTAAQEDETAMPYEKQYHGLFTYYLLKKLQESKGEVSLGELKDYVVEKVRQQSVVINSKLQTPSIAVSPIISENWKTIKLK